MSTKLTPQEIRNIGIYGIIRESEVDSHLIPEGACIEAVSVHFDKKGAATLRPGIAALGATVSAGYSCVGMHNAFASTMLVVFSDGTNNDIYRYNGSAWAKSLEDDTAGSKTRFVDFAGRTVRLNGIDGSVRVWDGSTAAPVTSWAYTGNPINPQSLSNNSIKPKYGDIYKNKVYFIGDPTKPNRLYFSSVITSAGNITWTPSTDYVDFYPDDGEDASGLKRYSLELLVFKPNYIYRFRTSATDPDPLIKIGTRSNESIIEGKKGLYFHHETGFYKYTGAYPTEISRPISDIVDAIPLSYMDDITSWKDNDHIYWSVGNLTIEGNVWKNIVLRYTESSEIWTVYSYADGITWGSIFNNGTSITRTVGNDDGVVATFNSGNTDLGQPIPYRLISKWYEWDGIENKKIIQKFIGICEKAQGSKLMYQVDDKLAWEDLGQLKKYLNYFEPSNIEFHRIRIKLTGVSSSEAFIWRGLKIIEGINEGVIE